MHMIGGWELAELPVYETLEQLTLKSATAFPKCTSFLPLVIQPQSSLPYSNILPP